MNEHINSQATAAEAIARHESNAREPVYPEDCEHSRLLRESTLEAAAEREAGRYVRIPEHVLDDLADAVSAARAAMLKSDGILCRSEEELRTACARSSKLMVENASLRSRNETLERRLDSERQSHLPPPWKEQNAALDRKRIA
jgi:hypothetical protein